MNAIELEGVERRFGRKTVLRGASAALSKGRVAGLLGRNGEGKSTLLRILLDLLAADAGRVSVLGRSPDGSGALRALTGYVPERPSFHEFLTVGEVLAWRRRLVPGFSIERALSLCKRLELDPGAPVRGASKGTLGKLAWVCASAHEPELYLLDEPTSGLDALVREDVLGHLIGELQEAGRTVLVTNHRMEELAGLLDEVWLLSEGRLTVFDAEALRTQACRLRGRKAGGALESWTFLDEPAAGRFLAENKLEVVERQPLPMEEVFKVLLKEGSC